MIFNHHLDSDDVVVNKIKFSIALLNCFPTNIYVWSTSLARKVVIHLINITDWIIEFILINFGISMLYSRKTTRLQFNKKKNTNEKKFHFVVYGTKSQCHKSTIKPLHILFSL